MCFDSYNIPMTPKDDINTAFNDTAINLIMECYLNKFDIKQSDLFRKSKDRVKKAISSISLSEIRRALVYYLTQYTPLTLKQIAVKIGYGTDHSIVIWQRERARDLLYARDEKFTHYWNLLIDCANEI